MLLRKCGLAARMDRMAGTMLFSQSLGSEHVYLPVRLYLRTRERG